MNKLFLTLFGLFLSGCSLFGSSNISPLEDLSIPENTTDEYRVQAGDVLNVQVWGEPRLSGEVGVREDGKLTLPLAGDVAAEGATTKDIAAAITQGLAAYIPSASVSVSVAHTAPVRYYLSGQFIKPGEYRTDKRVTFLQAIATGGGFAPFADESSIMLIRKGETGELRYELDYNQVVDGKEPNPILKSGDVITIK